MASFTSVNYTSPVFPFVIPGKQLSFSVQPTLETQVTLIAQALEGHDHTTGKGVILTGLTNPMSAKGDIIVGTIGGVPIRKAHGFDGEVLTSDAASVGGVKWATVAGGSVGDVNLVQVGGAAIAIGQAAMAASLPVTLASNQSALAVTGSFWQVTQPVSIAVLPNPSNLDVALSTRLKSADTLAGVTTVGTVTAVTSITNPVTASLSAETTKVIGTVNIASGQTVGIAAGAAVIGHVIVDSGTITAVTSITNALPSGTNVLGHIIVDSGAMTVSQATPASLQATVTPAGSTTWATSSPQLPAALGQTTMAASLPVVLASDQSALSVSIPTSAEISLTDLYDTSVNGNATVRGRSLVVTDDTSSIQNKLIIYELRKLNQAFQDWSGTNPRVDMSGMALIA